MFAYLKGTLVKAAPDHVIVEVNGIGYRVYIPLSSYKPFSETGSEVKILTYLRVREDEQSLYGFATEEERGLFQLLLGVSKVGPKVALAVLGGISVSAFKQAVAFGDADLLSTIHGIGKKSAERLIVELKDKITLIPQLRKIAEKAHLAEGDEKISDVMGALISLGYKQARIQKALSRTLERAEPGWPVDRLLKETLKYI